jgi:hypothetical protein
VKRTPAKKLLVRIVMVKTDCFFYFEMRLDLVKLKPQTNL